MAKVFSRRVLAGRRLLEFAAGEYHEKYVPESPFKTNPLLAKAKAAALKKTEPKLHTSYSNISAEGQAALDTLRERHKYEINKVQSEAPLLVKMAQVHKRHDIPMSGPDMEQALAAHEAKIRDLKAGHLIKENEAVFAHGGNVHRQWVAPGMKLRGRGKPEPTLHPSWVNYAVNINAQGRHKEHLDLIAAMKAAGETKPTPGKITPIDITTTEPMHEIGSKFYPKKTITTGGIEKSSAAKLAAEKTKYRKEILSGKTPWKGYKSELMGSRRKARQTMAEELGYKISREGKIQVTGVRQIIQAQRKLTGGGPRPVSEEFWKKLQAGKAPNAPKDPYGHLPLGTRPREQQTFLPSGHRPTVGLAGAGPAQIEEYGGEMKRVQSNLGRLVEEEQARRGEAAAALKTRLQSKADINIAKWHPQASAAEVTSRRETAVNKLLHGSVDPKRVSGTPIVGEELARHAGTIGVSVPQAKKLRSKFRGLTDVSEAGEKKIRSSFLATAAPFMEAPSQIAAPTDPKYPHLKKLGIGVGIGAGVLGGAYLARRFLRGRRQEQEARMASLQKLIYFAARRSRAEAQRTVLAKDRYMKQIKHADLAAAISNYARSAGVGAGLGLLLKGKMPAGRALKIGAAGGLGAEAITRAYTARTKDPFGERPWQAKEADKAPAEAGAAVGAGLLTKKYLPNVWKTVTKFAIKNPNDPDADQEAPAWHDIATGSIEGGAGVLATDRLIRKFAPEGSAVGRKLAIGAGVGGLATGAIGYSLNRLVRKKVAERRQQKQQAAVSNLRSRIRLIQFIALTEDERERNRQIRKWSGRGLRARGEEIYTWGGRGIRTARDIRSTISGRPSLDTRGRPRKKEWEKPWFYKKLALGAITAGLGGLALYKTKGGQSLLSKLGDNPVGRFVGGVKSELGQLRESTKPLTGGAAVKAKNIEIAKAKEEEVKRRGQVKDILGMVSRIRPIRFAETLDYWDVNPYSRRQAVVTAPGGQRRYRRKKKFLERKDVREAILGTGIVGALGGGYGIHAWRKRHADGGPPPPPPPGAEQLHLPMAEGVTKKAAGWTREGFLKPRVKFSYRGKVIVFEDKKRDYVSPAVGAGTGVGGFFAGGLYRGRKLQEGEDITGRRVTRPHTTHPLLQHEGIGIGEGRVAQVHYKPEMGKYGLVTSVSEAEFGGGKPIRVLDRSVSEAAAKRARAGVGTKVPYTLFYNNCQRFGGCARFGRSRVVPRQLRTALLVGGAAGAGGFGASKLIRSRRKELSAQGRLILFRAMEEEKSSLVPTLRKTAIIGGLGAAAIGTRLLPAATKMMKIAGREYAAKAQTRLAATKGLRGIVPAHKPDPHSGGKLVYDYIDSSQRYLNSGLLGQGAGALVRPGVAEPKSLLGRVSNKMFPGHFGPAHFARFRAGPLQALGHWDYEYGQALEHKLKPNIHPVTKREIPVREKFRASIVDKQTRMHYGREAAHAEINDALWNKGMNENEALRHVTHKSTNPLVHDYFNQLAGSKKTAALKYAKLSGISPGLIAGGGGTAAVGAFAGRRDNKK